MNLRKDHYCWCWDPGPAAASQRRFAAPRESDYNSRFSGGEGGGGEALPRRENGEGARSFRAGALRRDDYEPLLGQWRRQFTLLLPLSPARSTHGWPRRVVRVGADVFLPCLGMRSRPGEVLLAVAGNEHGGGGRRRRCGRDCTPAARRCHCPVCPPLSCRDGGELVSPSESVSARGAGIVRRGTKYLLQP